MQVVSQYSILGLTTILQKPLAKIDALVKNGIVFVRIAKNS
jgi:hypothetical protein